MSNEYIERHLNNNKFSTWAVDGLLNKDFLSPCLSGFSYFSLYLDRPKPVVKKVFLKEEWIIIYICVPDGSVEENKFGEKNLDGKNSVFVQLLTKALTECF